MKEEIFCPHAKSCRAYEIVYKNDDNLSKNEVINLEGNNYRCEAGDQVDVKCSHITLLNMLDRIENQGQKSERKLSLINLKSKRNSISIR